MSYPSVNFVSAESPSAPDASAPDLRWAVNEIMARIVAELRRQASPWMTYGEAADYLRVSTSTIRNLAAAGIIREHFPEGCSIPKFNRKDLDRCMTMNPPKTRRGLKPKT